MVATSFFFLTVDNSIQSVRLRNCMVVIATVLLIGSFGFSYADTGHVSLYKQLENRTAGNLLYCGNPEHTLVIRTNMKFACAYPETAFKLSWHPVVFDSDGNVTISDSINLRSHERDYRISYTIVEGLLSGIWYDSDLNSIMLEIRSIDDGKIKLSVPKLFFEEYSEHQEYSFIVLQNEEEISFKKLPDEHSHLLQFNFTNSDPVIEIIYVLLV